MKGFGIALTMVGVLVAFVAALLPTSVDSVGPDYSLGLGSSLASRSARVVNLDLLQRQTLTFAAGATFFLSGIVLLGAGSVIDELKALQLRQADPLQPLTPVAHHDRVLPEVEEDKPAEETETVVAQLGPTANTADRDMFPLISMGIAVGLAAVALLVGYLNLQH